MHTDIPKEYRPLPENIPKFKEAARNPANPSIPSKWETRRMGNSDSRDGFGSRKHRFDRKMSDIPGPGFYHEDKNQILRKSASLSKKGFGNAFVSKSSRLAPTVTNHEITGPAYYTPKSVDEVYAPPVRGKFNEAGVDKGRVPYRDPLSNGPRPGPGYYEVEVKYLPGYLQKKPSSTFASESGRESFLLSTVNADTPSPMAYDPNIASTLPDRKIMWSKSQYKRFQDLGVDNKVPGPGRYFDEVAKQEEEVIQKMTNRRSVGTRPPKLLGKQNEKRKETIHTFGADVNRFKHSFLGNLDAQREMPGPGWYSHLDISALNKEKTDKTQASGVFKMTGPQTADMKKPLEHRPPGPAYYCPEKPKPKQFFVNTDGRWV